MCQTSLNFRTSVFRRRGVAWLLLVIFASSFMPSLSFAQQPTATIRTLNGNVLVSGQAAKTGMVLRTGDTLQTQARASVVLALSDGSEIQLGEQTQINLADLAQTAAGARVSSIKLLAGWLRALLSAQHQQKGSSFTIETPNAQVGVKFSQPDVEVSYDPAKQETIGIAHTVELIALNLLTNEKITVPVGSSVVIIGLLMKVITGTTAAAIAAGAKAVETGTAAAGTTTAGAATGMSTGTMVAIGAGVAAVVGGVVAVAASSGDKNGGGGIDWNNPFTGTFSRSQGGWNIGCCCWYNTIPQDCISTGESDVLTFIQQGTSLTGTSSYQVTIEQCCTASATTPLTGTVMNETSATVDVVTEINLTCTGNNCSFSQRRPPATIPMRLEDNGNTLYFLGSPYTRNF